MKDQNGNFIGFYAPQYTQVPDEILDELICDLSLAELRVLLYIVRRTFGFKKINDNISLNQLMKGIVRHGGRFLDRGTGLSKKTLLHAIKSLEEKNIIVRTQRTDERRGNLPNLYALNIITPLGEEITPYKIQYYNKQYTTTQRLSQRVLSV